MHKRETQGERVRRIRNERGLKQIFIAKKAGITQAHLSRIENDESGVTDSTLKKVARAIGLPFEELAVRPPGDKDALKSPDIDDVLSDEAAMIRFMGGEKPDAETYEWIRRSLEVIRSEMRRRRS